MIILNIHDIFALLLLLGGKRMTVWFGYFQTHDTKQLKFTGITLYNMGYKG